MCDHVSETNLFPQINLAKVPEHLRELRFCRICSYIYRECENMGQLNCRFHPHNPEPYEDADHNQLLRYPCCGITAHADKIGRVTGQLYSDGCTLCDHLPMENCEVYSEGARFRIRLPEDINTPFHTENTRETYKRIYNIDFLEVFPSDMTRKFNIPAPHADLIVSSFSSLDEFNAWLEEPDAFVETYVGGLSGRRIREPRSRLSKNSLGANYIRAVTAATRPAAASELSAGELRRANLQASYHNTWKEAVPITESSALLYRRPEDFFRQTQPTQIRGEIVVYQRGKRQLGILWKRRGKPTGIFA